MSDDAAARRDLRAYPLYVAGVESLAWMPVFFIYFSQHLPLAHVLLLEALYYVSVVLLELPSGYFSDRFGRRPTLVIAASSLLLAYLCFAATSSLWTFALAQVLLAAGLSFNSGTDTSFHLATLQRLDISEEYEEREARLARLAMLVNAGAALAGGALGSLDLRFAYLVSAAGAALSLGAALSFTQGAEERDEESFLTTLRRCLGFHRQRRMAWLLVAVIVATIVNHLPYEFYQPYLAQLDGAPWAAQATPLVSGLHVTAVQLVGALIAAKSAALSRRFGVRRHVLFTIALQVALVWVMALSSASWVVALLVMRSIPRALQVAPLRAAIAPHVAARFRATYLSFQSLLGRLGFAIFLLCIASLDTSEALGEALRMSAVGASALLLVTLVLALWWGAEEREA